MNNRVRQLCAICATVVRNKMFGRPESTMPDKIVDRAKLVELMKMTGRACTITFCNR